MRILEDNRSSRCQEDKPVLEIKTCNCCCHCDLVLHNSKHESEMCLPFFLKWSGFLEDKSFSFVCVTCQAKCVQVQELYLATNPIAV